MRNPGARAQRDRLMGAVVVRSGSNDGSGGRGGIGGRGRVSSDHELSSHDALRVSGSTATSVCAFVAANGR